MAKRKVKHPRKARKEAARTTKSALSSRDIITVAGAAAFVVLVLAGFNNGLFKLSGRSGGGEATPSTIAEGATLGPANAPVTVTEYSDYQ